MKEGHVWRDEYGIFETKNSSEFVQCLFEKRASPCSSTSLVLQKIPTKWKFWTLLAPKMFQRKDRRIKTSYPMLSLHDPFPVSDQPCKGVSHHCEGRRELSQPGSQVDVRLSPVSPSAKSILTGWNDSAMALPTNKLPGALNIPRQKTYEDVSSERGSTSCDKPFPWCGLDSFVHSIHPARLNTAASWHFYVGQ